MSTSTFASSYFFTSTSTFTSTSIFFSTFTSTSTFASTSIFTSTSTSIRDSLTPWEARILFLLYDRFNSCCGCIGFPVPPGFTSFFAYLSYRTLERRMFLQYVERGVFELNIDVIKAVFADIPDDLPGVQQKLALLSLLPRSRIKRILNHWSHPLAVMLRAREHALSVLVGTHASSQHRYARKTQGNGKYQAGVGVNSSEMLPCFDSFLRLLLAKVNLNELDVQLLLEATTSSLSLN
ncbi:hypothetical protein M8J77_004317 [Diaphorina citri]|nr:hypothetical protein M8J77_004317 [Diaphorina citri]